MYKLTLTVAQRATVMDGKHVRLWVAQATLTIMEGPNLGEYSAIYSDITRQAASQSAMKWVADRLGQPLTPSV